MKGSPMRLRSVVAMVLLAAPAFAQERLSMEEVVRRAVLRSVTSVVAEQEIVRARGILKESRAPSLPTLTANGVVTKLDHDRISNGQVSAYGSQQSANVTLTVPLIAPQRWLEWSHASDQLNVAKLSAEDARRQVAVFSARLYLAVMAQHRLVQINREARDAAKEHLDDAHARYEVGSGNRLDEVRAGQELATDDAAFALAQTVLFRSMEALGSLVGSEAPVDALDEIALPEAPSTAQGLEDAQTIR